MKYVLPNHNVSLKYNIILFLLLFILHKPLLASSIAHHDKSHGDTLIIGEFVRPSLINPILTHSTISAALKELIFDGLIKINERMEPEPHLARSWNSSKNGSVWTFYLRKNVHFHDGVELTAKDIKYTYDKINDPSTNSPLIGIFKNFKAVYVKDRYTVEIDLKNPISSLLFYLDVGILPKHLLMGKNLRKAEFNYYPIGTGIFKMESWSKDEIVLKANEDYFKGKPYLNKVMVKCLKDQRVVWAELMKGSIDCVFLAYPRNYDIIKKNPDFDLYSFLCPYCYILGFNEKNRLFSQKEVRQALNYAIDKERIITKVLRRKGRVCLGTTYPQSWVYNEAIKPYPYDPKKAVQLLQKAGWNDANGNHILDKYGREFEFFLLIVNTDDVAQESSLHVQQQLLDIGVRMKVKPLSVPMMYERFLSTKEFDAALLTILSDNPDRNYAWWHSSQIDGGFNVFSYRNKKIDEFLDKGRSTLDREGRKAIYHRFQKEIHDDPPGIFLFWRDYLVGINKRFKGIRLNPVRILSNINEWYVPKDRQKYK